MLVCSCSTKTPIARSQAQVRVEKKIAVLPFNVFSQLREFRKGKTLDMLREEDRVEGITMQRDMYRYFLRKMSRLGYPQDFIQDVNVTNDILEQNGIDYGDIVKMRREELARLLNVDGVVSGMIDQLAPQSSFVVGLMNGNLKSNRVKARFTYHNSDGHLIWKVDRKSSGGDEELTYGLSKQIMRKIPDKFPFKRI